MKNRVKKLWIAMTLLAGVTLSVSAAVTFTISPAAISNTYAGKITLQISGLTNTETVTVQKYLDANSNGVVDAGDLLWQQFQLTDGSASVFYEGSTAVTNFTVPGDTDGTANGQITAHLYPDFDFAQVFVAQYLFVVSSPVGHFLPVTNTFTVTNYPFAQSLTGIVVSNSAPVPNAVVILFSPQAGGGNLGSPQGGVVADNSGHYTIKAPPGSYTLAAVKSNFVANLGVSPTVTLGAGATITTNVPLTNATESISGKIVDANNSSLGLGGCIISAQSADHLLGIGFTDTNGNFTMRVTPSQWKVNANEKSLAVKGYLSLQNKPIADTTDGSVSGVTISLPKVTAVFYGMVQDNLGNPLPGVAIYSEDNNDDYEIDGFTDSNGNYVAGAVGGLNGDQWQVGEDSSSQADYVFSQGTDDVTLSAGQAYAYNFTALLATNHITGDVLFNGSNVVGVGLNAFAVIGGVGYQAGSADTGSGGNYSLNVANGDWSVNVKCNGSSDSLDSILGSGNYQCPNGEDVFITNNNGAAIFSVPVQNSTPQLDGFGGNGSGWTLNNNQGTPPSITSGVLTIVNGFNTANSAFYDTPQNINGFTASFVWQNTVTNDGFDPGDGMVFTLQNQGTNAVGIAGSGLGYEGVSPASGVAFNLYQNHIVGIGYAPLSTGNGSYQYQSTGNINFDSTDPIAVTIAYNNITQVLSVSLTDNTTLATYSASFDANVTSDAGGNTAYVGFTGGSLSAQSYQTISQFTFTPNTVPVGGSVITANLPADTVIVNISGTQNGAGSYNNDQSLWYAPFTANGSPLLEYTVQPGTYNFRAIDSADAAQLFSSLTAAQTSQIYTGWTYNYPWVEDYLVFPSTAATNGSVSQLFDGAPTTNSFNNAINAYNGAVSEGTYDLIRPGSRDSTLLTNAYTFTSAETLIFAVPDYALSDNAGGVSVVITPLANLPTLGPLASQTVQCGYTATFTAGATSAQPISYQWWENDGFEAFSLSGETNASLVLSGVETYMSGYTFYVVASTSSGSVTSQQAVLTVVDTMPPVLSVSGQMVNPVGTLVQATNGNFYGVTDQGGANNDGSIFEMTPAGALTTLYSFTGGNDGGFPQDGLTLGTNGNLYGTAYNGGVFGEGAIYEITPAGSFSDLYDFGTNGDGGYPSGALTVGADGNFYGTTSYGGTNYIGSFFVLTPAGSLTTLYSFSQTNGGNPRGRLWLGSDGSFYGTTGSYGNGYGTVFKITSAGSFTLLHRFHGSSDGSYPQGGVIQGNDGNFYGTTSSGGPRNEGTVFQITPSGAFTTVHFFSGTVDGSYPEGSLALGNNGNLYGTTQYSADGGGTVFELAPPSGFSTLYTFAGNQLDGNGPGAGLVLGSDGNFYGTTVYSGLYNNGTVFRITPSGIFTVLAQFIGSMKITVECHSALNPPTAYDACEGFENVTLLSGNVDTNTPGNYTATYTASDSSGNSVTNTFTVIVRDTTPPVITPMGGNGFNPNSGLIAGPNNNFYGTTYSEYNTSVDQGTVFSMTSIGLVTNLYTFTGGSDGAGPAGFLLWGKDGNFYGGTTSGGANDLGTVFRLTPAGLLTTLHAFTGGNDGDQITSLMQASNGMLYGTAEYGGTNGNGLVFSLNSDSVLTPVYSFGGADDSAYPLGVIQGSDGNLYGITQTGGNYGNGIVFKLTTSGTLTTLYSFSGDNINGGTPVFGLVQGTNGNFYGATQSGGQNGNGTIYEITPSGGLTTLYSFNVFNNEQSAQVSSLNLASDGSFYGETLNGGTNANGSVFMLTPSGQFTLLHSFNYSSDGDNPAGALTQGTDGNFYGATLYGGQSGNGLAFKMSAAGAVTPMAYFGGGITLPCGAAFTDPGATANDACAGNLTADIGTNGSVDTSTPGLYIISYSATDPSTNTGYYSRPVTVVGSGPPTLVLNGSSTVEIALNSSFADQGATATGSCGEQIPVTETNNIDVNVPGIYTVTYVATSFNGFSATNTRTVVVASPSSIYDPAAQFSASANPSGDWSYGYSITLGSPLILYPTPFTYSGVLVGWQTNIALGVPLILYNPTATVVSYVTAQVNPGGLILHPGPSDQYSILRFTVPSTGQYVLSGSFFGADTDGTTTDVHILTNGLPMFDGEVTGFGPNTGPSFNLTVALNAGDFLDFAVGYGANQSFYNDSTELSVQIASLNATSLQESCVSAPAGLAGWWPGNGSAVDVAGEDLGYLEGGAGYGPGLAGEAFAFAGGGQGVLLPYELGTDLSALSGYGAPNGRGAAGWTVEGWVRPASNNHAEYPTIYSYGYWGASLGLESGTGVLESWINDDNVLDGSIVVPVGQWSHVAVTYDGTNRTLYVNGLAAGADQPGELAGPAYVGSAIGNVAPLEAESGFDGEIGGISVYGRGLTGGEIASIYRAGSLGKCVIYGEPAVGLFTPAGGGAGTLVRLVGSGFLLTTNVTFNGRAADFAVESDGALAAYAPAGVATGPIGVEGGAGAVVTARSFTVAAAGCDAAPAGLVSWWPGDGTAADALGAHHGVMENGAGYGAGLKGEAFSFNGTGAYADMGPINVGSAWTIEGWVNASALPAGRHSVAGTEDACADWAISFDDGEFGARYAPADGSCTASVPSGLPVVAGTWYHVAAVCDGTNALVYVDGELANLAPVKPFYQAYAGGDFEVGGEYCCAGDNFPGLVDELAVYNRALTAGEIAGLYNAGAAGKCALSGQAAVTVAASPAAGGTAGGGGSYALGSAVTVTAAPSAAGRWVFEGWTEGGFLLSTNAAYTFSVFSDQQLVAEFEGATNVVTEQPAGQTVELGSSAELTAAVTSPGALRYQWYEGAAPVAGGTNATLVLRQVTLGQQGSYELVASNGYGSVTSQLAVLSVAVTAVAVTSPTNGTELTGPAGLTLSATASDAHGIQEVDYYTNGVLLGVGSGPQNSLAVAGLTGGSYAVRAVAVDGLGLSGTSAVVHVTVSNPGTTLLDFEAVDAAGGGAGGAVLSNYLARFGVRTTNTSAGAGPVVEDDRVFLGGNGVRASSGDNFLTQTGANGAVSNTLLFAQGYASVSWVRTRLVAGTAGASLPGWRAHAYDSAGNELGAVGESAQTSYTDVPAAGFTLLGPGIASIRFEGNNNGAGALNTLPLDDLLLSTLASGSLLTVSLSSGNGTELTAPGTVALAAAVGDGNGAVVTNVDFYEGVSYLGSAAPAGGVAGWTENRLAAGSYGFTAVASDTAGAARSSSPLNLTVAGVAGLSVLNFDSLNTSGGSVSGAALSNYLAGYGAGLSNVTLGTAVEAVNAGGVTVGGGAAAPSPPNYLTQAGVSGAVSFTLWFTTPVRGLGFTRAGLVAGAAGASHPQWQATLLDVNGVALGSAGEGLILSPTNVPARVFGLTGQNGAGVAAVRFDSDSLGKAAFTAVLLDDVILNTNPVAAGLSVTLTSPASGAPGLAALQPITLGAAPADTVGLVDHVSFYAGGALLGSAGRSPYEFTWTNAVAGSYALRAQVVDTNGETAYSGAVQVVVGAGADQTVVNFDGLDARGGAVTGAVLSNYLAGYGMSASNQTAGAEVAVENQGLLGKGLLVAASSPPNALTQIGAAGPVAYTVRFGRLLSGFGFTRPELLASPYASQAGWQATAYDLAGVALGQVGEGPTGSYSNVSARAFELGGPGIASVQISSEGTGLTALNAVVLDDFVLTTNAGAFPPAVVLTSPVNGLAVTGSAELTVAADAVDAVGLASVSFYTNGGLLGVAAGLPYSAGWTNPPAGSYAVTAVALNTSGLMRTSAVVSVTVLPAASQFGILTQPVSQTAAAGSSVNFTVTTTGTGAVAYQWYQNGTPLAGQTGDGLTIYPAGSGNAGTYTVTASSGGVTLTSAGAALAVIQPPVFTAQPQGQMVGPGANVTLTNAVAGDGPFSWQWRLNGAGIAGATNSSYAILAAQPLDSGAYQVVAANAVGFAVSAVAPVTVRAAVAAQTTNDDFANRISLNPLLGPVSGYNNSLATAEPGEPEHDGKPGGKSIWFTWQASFTGVISLTTLGSDFDTLLAVYTGTNVARLTPVAADDDSGGYFTSLVSFNVTAGTNYQIAVDGFNGASGNVVLGMPSGTGYRVLSVASGNSVPVIREQPVSQLAVAGSQVVLGVAATGARTYQWNFNGTPIPGATNRVLALPNFQRGAVGLYNVLVANAAGSVASEEAAVQISVVNSGNRAAAQMKFGEAADTTGGGGNAGPGPQDGGDTRGFTVSQTFSTVGATREAGEPETCGQAGGASEWYAYTAPASGTLNVSAAGSGFNTIVGVYTGTGEDFASLTEQGCDYTTNYQTHQPDVMIGGVAAGSVYYIVVDGYQGASGVVQLQIGLGQPPTVLAEPASQLATLGSNATFSVSAVGSTNLYYQWRLNGANLALATNASYTTAAAGSYTVVVSNAVGVVTSAPPAVLTAQLAPGLVTQPASQTVLAGSNVQLTVSAAGVSTPANPLLYQWYDNGAAVAGATGPVLALAPAQWTNSGSYFVVVANSYGSATSAVAVLTVQDLTPPTVTVTSPGPNAIVPASPVTVSGTAGDNVGVSLVRVRVGTNGYQTAAGTTSWSLPVALSPGTNTVTVQSQDLAGNLSVPAALTLRYQIPWPLTVLTNGTGGTTSPAGASNGAVLVIGNNYTIQAVPGNNWLFARWSAGTNAGTLTNLSSRALLSFTMSTNLVLEAGFDTNLFPSVAGASYNGLFAPGGGVTEASSGFLTLRLIGNTGAYSATLMLDGGTYPFTGGFDPLGSAQTNLNRAGKTPVAVTLSLHLNPPDGLLTGTLVGDTWSASLLAERAVFNAVTLPATNYAGKYTLAIPPGSNAPALSPDGWGYATLTATTGGNATFLGALADGTTLSRSVPVAGDGDIPFYLSLYGGRGSLQGWIMLSNQPPPTLTGELNWIKPALAGALYPLGFTNLSLAAPGSGYATPAAGGLALSLPGGATLILSNGNLAAPLVYAVGLSRANTLTNQGNSNPTNLLTGTINPATGALTVTFRATGAPTNTTARGVLLQNQTNALGSFPGAQQSGSLQLQPN